MSYAEMFLMAWAGIATVLAGHFLQTARRAMKDVSQFVYALKLISENKLEVVKTDDGFKVQRKGGSDGLSE